MRFLLCVVDMPKNYISVYRKKAGLRQDELGRLLQPPISQGVVSGHERQHRTPTVYQAIEYARVFGCTVEDIFPTSLVEADGQYTFLIGATTHGSKT